jgi:hypothetical protein
MHDVLEQNETKHGRPSLLILSGLYSAPGLEISGSYLFEKISK